MGRYSTAEPAGTIKSFGTATPPARWLVCDGSPLLEASYPGLYSKIGTAYGIGSSVFSQNTITTNADVSGSLQSTGFALQDAGGVVGVWLNLGGLGVQPTIPSAYRYIMVSGNINDANTTIASEIQTALAADSSFSTSTVLSNVVTAVNTQVGIFVASDFNTGFAFANTVAGVIGFNLPDLRGIFPRGQNMGSGNDPDVVSRTATNGGNSGDAVGSFQFQAMGQHEHYYPFSGNTGTNTGSPPQTYPSFRNIQNITAFTSGVYGANAGSDTRPVNVNVVYMIRF